MENPGDFQSPRGPMEMDPATHNPIEHFYVYQNVKENGQVTPKILADTGESKTPSS
jgi:branched-chain amino acid transport system substrate-binding protein